MTAEYMNLTAQAATSHWGWTIAFFLWFVGLSGMSLFLNYWVRSRRIHYAATAAAVVGTLLVVSHLGRILNLPAAALEFWFHQLDVYRHLHSRCALRCYCASGMADDERVSPRDALRTTCF